MPSTKKYLRDKTILTLFSVNLFLLILMLILILLRLGFGQGGSYISQYRSNLGIGAFSTGSLSTFLFFMLFGGFVFLFHLALSVKIYAIRRQFAIVILSLSALLLLLGIIVSNALLVLR
jgi:hypothetical protein